MGRKSDTPVEKRVEYVLALLWRQRRSAPGRRRGLWTRA